MSIKLSSRQVGDVTVVDAAGRITLGEGSERVARHAARHGRQRAEENPAQPERGFLYRQLGDRRTGVGIHHGHQPGRLAETAGIDEAGEGSAADHQTVHGVRRPRRRSVGGAQLRVRDTFRRARGLCYPAADKLHDFDFSAGRNNSFRPESALRLREFSSTATRSGRRPRFDNRSTIVTPRATSRGSPLTRMDYGLG